MSVGLREWRMVEGVGSGTASVQPLVQGQSLALGKVARIALADGVWGRLTKMISASARSLKSYR